MAPPRRSPWRKYLLIPLWISRSLLTAAIFGWLVFTIAAAPPLTPIDVVYLLFCITTFLLSLTEMILYVKHNLQPLTYLIFQIVKTLFWFTYFIVVTISNQASEVSLINSDGYQIVPVDGWTRYVIAAALTLLSHVATLIYASVIYHRYRYCDTSRRPPVLLQNIRARDGHGGEMPRGRIEVAVNY